MSTTRIGPALCAALVFVLGACGTPPPPPDPEPTGPADLAVSLSIDDATPYYWAEVHLAVRVENLDDGRAAGVAVAVPMPTNLTYLDASGDYDSSSGVWTIGDLPGGAEAELTITARAGDVVLGEQTVTATVSSTTEDPDEANDSFATTVQSQRAPWKVGITPDPDNPPIIDMGIPDPGRVDFHSSVSAVVPGAPPPEHWLFWTCDRESQNPCHNYDDASLYYQPSFGYEISTFGIDTYTLTVTVAPTDPNYVQDAQFASVEFTTVTSGGI